MRDFMDDPETESELTPIPEWENVARGMLDEVEYDTELGMQMARDAIRVSNGEMTDAEFDEKYEDRVADEFGEETTPTSSESDEEE
jgi:hypothetical protein